MKKIFRKAVAVFGSIALIGILMFSLVGASMKITNIPDDVNSFMEWKQKVLDANGERGYLAVTYPWAGTCAQTCLDLMFFGDCNPCQSGEIASMCTWHPDSMSAINFWNSASDYCNDWLAPYSDYNKQCYCSVPTTECSGGGEPGDRKCEGYEVWECSNSGVWEYVSNCEYSCSSGTCQQQQCTDHTTKSCDGDSVYWFNSCGDKQEEYERCETDEKCEGDKCVRFCEEEFIGSKLCSGVDIVQQYQSSDCSTEIKTIETCQHGCENSQCKTPRCPTCSDPTEWSQCEDKKMFRSNYECSVATDYNCKIFTEEQSCECGTSGQCQYDETCESNICVTLECEENEVADNHECIEKSEFPLILTIGIGAGIILIILIVLLVIFMTRMKGGVRKK